MRIHDPPLPQKEEDSVGACLLGAVKDNGVSFALNAGSAAVSATPLGTAGKALVGLATSSGGLVNSAIQTDAVGAGSSTLAYGLSAASPEAARVGAQPGTSLGRRFARAVPGVGMFLAIGGAINDVRKGYEQYRDCRSNAQ